ncbi:hypothetical protein C7S14_7443 [Burkholderia cepacia]|nr:hypothetical protein C7S14_7443 [Burkholderia cepacia]
MRRVPFVTTKRNVAPSNPVRESSPVPRLAPDSGIIYLTPFPATH